MTDKSAKWFWMTDWCFAKGLAPANPINWNEAEAAWIASHKEDNMSKQIGSMHTTKGDLTLTKYFGGDKGAMLQITQGAGTIIGPDTPGFIQLSKHEAQALARLLSVYKTLQPCPFCDEHLKLDMARGEIGHLFWIICKSCKTNGPTGTDKDEATELWNTRQRG